MSLSTRRRNNNSAEKPLVYLWVRANGRRRDAEASRLNIPAGISGIPWRNKGSLHRTSREFFAHRLISPKVIVTFHE